MNKFYAILGVLFIVLLIFIEATHSRIDSVWDMIIYIAANVLLVLSLLLYCGFATLHAVQHVSDPVERAWWVVSTVVLNIAGSSLYYFTKYHAFRKIGKGGITLRGTQSLKKLSQLSESELKLKSTVEATAVNDGASR